MKKRITLFSLISFLVIVEGFGSFWKPVSMAPPLSLQALNPPSKIATFANPYRSNIQKNRPSVLQGFSGSL